MRRIYLAFLALLLLFATTYGQWGRPERSAWGRHEPTGAAAEAWSPADMDSILYWWRADSLVTECTAESDSVETWTDIISGGVLAYAAGADSCSPTWVHGADGIGGQDAIMGDGIYDRLSCNITDTPTDQPYCIWIVCTIPTDNDDPNIVLSIYQASRGIYANWDGGYHRIELKLVGWSNYPNLTADSTQVLIYVNTSDTSCYINGTDISTSEVITASPAVISIIALFSYLTGGVYTYPSRLKVAEIGVCDGIESDADRLLLEAYVKSRYGLTW